MKLLLLLTRAAQVLPLAAHAEAGRVGIGTVAPDPSARRS